MGRKKINVTVLNTVSSFLLQIVLIISGFVIPRIILIYFGSEVNGLVSSLTQFLSYISIVEGGVTGVLMASLYKPLHDHDHAKISAIIKTATNFYRRIGLILLAYTLVLAIVFPLVTNSNFSFVYISSLTVILSLSLLIQYVMALSVRTLLTADKKLYIVSFTQIAIAILSMILAYVSVVIYPDIHILKFITGVLYFLQPVVFNHYVKKYYKIDKNVKEDKVLLKSRWDGFAVNIAAFIHNCTDIVILTVFTNLQTVSVYSVYALVTMGLRSIIQSIGRGITPTIGHSLASGDNEKLNRNFASFEFIIFTLVFGLFSLASLLITPFVMIYTEGVTDANYYQPVFAILILVSEAAYLIREHHVSLAYSANKFKEITRPCFIEAAINIIVSVALVGKFGLIGVAIGTIVAMSYRSIYQVLFTRKLIRRPFSKFLRNFIIFGITIAIGILICVFTIPPVEYNIGSWFWHGVAYSVIIGTVMLVMMSIFYRDELKKLKNMLKYK